MSIVRKTFGYVSAKFQEIEKSKHYLYTHKRNFHVWFFQCLPSRIKLMIIFVKSEYKWNLKKTMLENVFWWIIYKILIFNFLQCCHACIKFIILYSFFRAQVNSAAKKKNNSNCHSWIPEWIVHLKAFKEVDFRRIFKKINIWSTVQLWFNIDLTKSKKRRCFWCNLKAIAKGDNVPSVSFTTYTNRFSYSQQLGN